MIPVLEHLATLDNVQEFIEQQMQQMKSLPDYVLRNSGQTPSSDTELGNKDSAATRNFKYSNDEVEDFKESIEAFDDELKLEDISESFSRNEQESRILSKYASSALNKPKGMLARYNEMSAIRKPREEKNEVSNDVFQIGQGSQAENNFASGVSSSTRNCHFSRENFRYQQVSLK
uniref:Uncharacterized protein n=1 Tax=Euplotes crassus TaxID=5936 RepID=A0A7S3KNT9_EUPCR|mmetsp:Transcript_34159/g.33742  ORF Transcript_34159/g.33742 Transcript_34159/m.33742 type:complete len:175 (+) Transcript_34159:640-1164(+)|eukprot:CAMPEP_0196996936 /NCGR_PEP_ID=MMETSP1380-20130617/2703_1 /TAXON_ID=5936 /ORGANISM="Euplotes crassus, Strain CT5" /LENGTH=174 /DNA_ID=CAMNT_0042413057 /DNA_START=640 /DNA_END=1164 /DNA_ORIENTATION=-